MASIKSTSLTSSRKLLLALLVLAGVLSAVCYTSLAGTVISEAKEQQQEMAASAPTTVGQPGRPNFAFAASACTSATLEVCNDRGLEIKNDCEYRGEDGGTPYTSCKCQAIRHVKECYQNAGCDTAFIVEISPECFGIQ